MGNRICFFINPEGKRLRDWVEENYAHYRAHILELERSNQAEWNEATFSAHVVQFLTQNDTLRWDAGNKEVIDDLPNEFYDAAEWMSESDRAFTDVGGWLYTSNYTNSQIFIQGTCDAALIRLWHFLVRGRSILDGGETGGADPENRVGYLSAEEVQLLAAGLRRYFGREPAASETYWTDKMNHCPPAMAALHPDIRVSERRQWSFRGIICALEVLGDLEGRGLELVSMIDRDY